MNKTITIRGEDNKEAQSNSNSIQNYVWDKFTKIEKLLSTEQEPINVDIVITIVRPHPSHSVEIRLRAPRYNIVVKRENPEIYKAIDEALDITWEQMNEEKKERKDNVRKYGYKQKIKDRLIK